MRYKELDSVVLLRDLPEDALRRSDTGTIVHLHTADAFIVEFLDASGDTTAVVELTSADVRPPTADDQLAVRSRQAAARRA